VAVREVPDSTFTVQGFELGNGEQRAAMPEISRFFGIVVGMFHDEHRPPHFHVRYAEYQAVIRIKDLVVTEGHLPPRTLGLVIEWAAQHQNELLRNWELAETKRPLKKIEPLE
jgi:Domain of unknown function (DUF4160)